MKTKCIFFDVCGRTHPTGMKLLADGWGLQGRLGQGYKAICPECLERERKERNLLTCRVTGGAKFPSPIYYEKE